MIIAQRYHHHVTNANCIALWCFDNHRSFFDGTNCHDSNLWLIDDWSTHDASKTSYIGKCKRATCCIIRSKLIVTRCVGKTIYLFGESDQV